MKFIAKFDSLSQGEDRYPVVDGVVDCPVAIGRELGLEPVEDKPDAKSAGKGKDKK